MTDTAAKAEKAKATERCKKSEGSSGDDAWVGCSLEDGHAGDCYLVAWPSLGKRQPWESAISSRDECRDCEWPGDCETNCVMDINDMDKPWEE